MAIMTEVERQIEEVELRLEAYEAIEGEFNSDDIDIDEFVVIIEEWDLEG